MPSIITDLGTHPNGRDVLIIGGCACSYRLYFGFGSFHRVAITGSYSSLGTPFTHAK